MTAKQKSFNAGRVFSVLLVFVLVIGMLTSCGTTMVDDANKNIIVEPEKLDAPSVNVYYNISSGMAAYLNDENYAKVIYSAYSAVDDAWNGTKKTVKTVGDVVSDADGAFFTDGFKDTALYTVPQADLFNLIEDVKEGTLAIVITELNSYLNDYNTVSNFIIKKGLGESRAVGIIGVDATPAPYYILVFGNSYHVSDYVTAFKERPDVVKISGTDGDEEFALDIERPINYQILAEKSGIMNIDYKNIDWVKAEGNFRRIEKTDREGLDNIEGTVNFNPKEKIVQIVGENTVDLGAVSLLSKKDAKKKYGGKVKMYIPFEIIDGVQLSTMDCKVTSELYVPDRSNKGKFKKYEGDYSEVIETDVAEGVTKEQGKWRVDNKTNSLIFNVTLPNAAKLPASSDVVKLDVTIEHFTSTETLPAWIKSWDNGKTENLVNMFATIYNYQEKSNKVSNTFTLYLQLK
ncbi:MAG: hypothetical protein J6A69_01765 [Clostridia bacterium]|nr:hypothetical protein [Clostridia bacterium]